MMDSKCVIKNFEFEIDVSNEFIHNECVKKIPSLLNQDFKKKFNNLLQKYYLPEKAQINKIDKIEIDIGNIFISEINSLDNLILIQLENFLDKSNYNNNLNIEVFTIDSFFISFVKTRIPPLWSISKDNLKILLSKDLIFQTNKDYIIEILTKDPILFRRFYNLFSKDNFIKIIDQLIGENKRAFQNIFSLNTEIFNIIFDKKSHKFESNLLFMSLNQTLTYKNEKYLEASLENTLSSKHVNIGEILNNYKKISNKNNLKIKDLSYFLDFERFTKNLRLNYKDFFLNFLSSKYSYKNKKLKNIFKKILNERDYFLRFLNENKNDIDLIKILSLISTHQDFKKEFVSIKNIFDVSYLRIENDFLKFHKLVKLTNENEQTIKSYLRFIFLKNLSQDQNYKIIKEIFFHEIVYDITISGKLNKKDIIKYVSDSRNINSQENNLFVSIFDDYKYSNISEDIRTSFFYKDLYYYFLEKNNFPNWSSRREISKNEILIFLRQLVKSNDKTFLKVLFSSENIIKNFIDYFIHDSYELFVEIIEFLSNNIINLNSNSYIALTKDNNTVKLYILSLVLKFRLWDNKSARLFNHKLVYLYSSSEPKKILFSLKEEDISKIDNFPLLRFKQDILQDEINDLKSKFNLDKLSEGELQNFQSKIRNENYDIDYFTHLFKLSENDCILQLFLLKNSTNIFNSDNYKVLIKKIISYLIKNQIEFKKTIDYISNNDINKDLVYFVFTSENVIKLFNLNFDSEITKSVFVNIYSLVLKQKQVSSVVKLLSFFLENNNISKYENIDILSKITELPKVDFILAYKFVFYELDTIELKKIFYGKKIKEIDLINLEKLTKKINTSVAINNDVFLKTDLKINTKYKYDFSEKKYSKNFHESNIDFVNRYKDNILKSKDYTNFNKLIYYVEFGSFPYDSASLDFDDLNNFYETSLRYNFYQLKKYLFNWSKSEAKLNRLFSVLFQKSYEIKNKDFENLFSVIHPNLLKSFKFFVTFLNKNQLIHVNSKLFYDKKDYKSFENFDFKRKIEILKTFFIKWSKHSFVVNDYLKFIVNVFIKEISFPKKMIITNDMIMSLEIFEKNESVENIYLSFTQHLNLKINEIKNKKSANFNIKTDIKNELEDGVLISNAGLLLYWPFLKTLFSKLSLLNDDNKSFKDEISKDKAVLATDFFVNGSNSNEKDFIFNKVLCGVNLDKIIDTENKLSSFEIDICKSATEALLRNWEKVKSVQTLRDWFLKRDARLIENDDSFVLDVESRPPDVFLKSLNWTISLISYDLMEKKLIVNWKY